MNREVCSNIENGHSQLEGESLEDDKTLIIIGNISNNIVLCYTISEIYNWLYSKLSFFNPEYYWEKNCPVNIVFEINGFYIEAWSLYYLIFFERYKSFGIINTGKKLIGPLNSPSNKKEEKDFFYIFPIQRDLLIGTGEISKGDTITLVYEDEEKTLNLESLRKVGYWAKDLYSKPRKIGELYSKFGIYFKKEILDLFLKNKYNRLELVFGGQDVSFGNNDVEGVGELYNVCILGPNKTVGDDLISTDELSEYDIKNESEFLEIREKWGKQNQQEREEAQDILDNSKKRENTLKEFEEELRLTTNKIYTLCVVDGGHVDETYINAYYDQALEISKLISKLRLEGEDEEDEYAAKTQKRIKDTCKKLKNIKNKHSDFITEYTLKQLEMVWFPNKSELEKLIEKQKEKLEIANKNIEIIFESKIFTEIGSLPELYRSYKAWYNRKAESLFIINPNTIFDYELLTESQFNETALSKFLYYLERFEMNLFLIRAYLGKETKANQDAQMTLYKKYYEMMSPRDSNLTSPEEIAEDLNSLKEQITESKLSGPMKELIEAGYAQFYKKLEVAPPSEKIKIQKYFERKLKMLENDKKKLILEYTEGDFSKRKSMINNLVDLELSIARHKFFTDVYTFTYDPESITDNLYNILDQIPLPRPKQNENLSLPIRNYTDFEF